MFLRKHGFKHFFCIALICVLTSWPFLRVCVLFPVAAPFSICPPAPRGNLEIAQGSAQHQRGVNTPQQRDHHLW